MCQYLCLLLSMLLVGSTAAADERGPLPGTLEVVAEIPINPGNLAVTEQGRVFATVHQFRRADAQLIEVTGFNSYRAWPNESWNGAFGSGPNVLNSVLGIAIDRVERLWVLDNGLGKPAQTPKLIAFALETGDVVERYDFPPETGPTGSFLNDLAVDDERGFVYIADIGGSHQPALVVVDVDRGVSRRFEASESLAAEDVDLVIDGRVIGPLGDDGRVQPARIPVNPITLSADGGTLYFGAMNGESWYQLACLFARLLCRGNSHIAVLCSCCRSLKTNENPAVSGTFFSGNRRTQAYSLSSRRSPPRLRIWPRIQRARFDT